MVENAKVKGENGELQKKLQTMSRVVCDLKEQMTQGMALVKETCAAELFNCEQNFAKEKEKLEQEKKQLEQERQERDQVESEMKQQLDALVAMQQSDHAMGKKEKEELLLLK